MTTIYLLFLKYLFLWLISYFIVFLTLISIDPHPQGILGMVPISGPLKWAQTKTRDVISTKV